MGRIKARALTLILPLLLMPLAACAKNTGTPGQPMTDPDVIDRDQIESNVSASNAYSLILSMRPLWFQTRGLTTLRQAAGEEDIVVYMDNARLGSREALRRVPLGGIEYLQFFDAREATLRWGGGHLHGAILVSTQRR